MVPDSDAVLSSLARAGYRETGARRAVVGHIVRQGGSFTAQDVYAELAGRGVGRATVFRTLNTLHGLGLLNRLHSGDGCHRYTLCEPVHHHHLVCTDCGQVYPLAACVPEQAVQAAARAVDFRVHGHHVEVYGHCGSCADKG